MRLPVLLMLMCASGAATAAPGTPASSCTGKSRHVLRFYEYTGTQTDEAKASFSNFRGTVNQEVETANEYLDTPALGNLALSTDPAGVGFWPGPLQSPADAGLIAQSDSRILELFNGMIQPNGGAYVIQSNIYIASGGTTSAPLRVSESFVLDPNNYGESRSIHLAATYYALALDAGGRGCRPAQVNLLNKAKETLQDVTAPKTQINALRSRIQADLTKLTQP